MKDKKTKIKNKNYRKFIDEGIIKTLYDDDIQQVIDGIEHPNKEQAKYLVLILHLTGCRPKEALMLRPSNFENEGSAIKILIPTLKRGVARTIWLNKKDRFVQELYDWVSPQYKELKMFYWFISDSKKTIRYKLQDGTVKTKIGYENTTNKLTYWFNKWFSVLDPINSYTSYYLRHNRFSIMSQDGASMPDIKFWKGAKTMESVIPYVHMSAERGKKIANLMYRKNKKRNMQR